MATDIEKIYFGIQRLSDGKLTCGYNSRTNGLYSSESRARTQMNQRIRYYEKVMTYKHVTDEQRANYQKYIDDHKANHRIIEVKLILVGEVARIEKQ